MPTRDEHHFDQDPPERERDTIVVEDDSLREGFTQVPNILLRRPDLSHGAKIAYALLLSYAWQQDRCFPGQDALAKDMGVERKAVIRYLQELKAKDAVRVKRRGMGKTNVYFLPRLADVPKMGHQEVPPMGRADVRSMGQEEYPVKKTQNEEEISSFERHTPREGTGDDDTGRARGGTVEATPRSQEPPTPARASDDVSDPTTNGQIRRVPLSEILKLRQQATRSIGTGEKPASQEQAAATGDGAAGGVSVPVHTRSGKLKGSAEERERLGAYLGDFAGELGDESQLSSSITRALNTFKAANIHPDNWGTYLYEARSITQEHTAQITKRAGEGNAGLRRKNKMPYFFGVLEQLVGLRSEGEDAMPGVGRAG